MRPHVRRWMPAFCLLLIGLMVGLVAPGAASAQEIVVYSGRSEALVDSLFDRFTEETGIRVLVRYGDTAELAATILEEGRRSPADVYFAQDAGALGALSSAGRLQPLPESIVNKVDSRFRSPRGDWVGTSGRARVVAYNTDHVSPDELPDSIWGFTEPQWRGRIGWPPTNGSFQAFVTALRILEGEARAEEWLRGIQANQPRVYHNNTAVVDAIGRGEVDVGFVNHYYLFRFLAEHGDDFPVRHHYTAGDAGSMINIAGMAVLDSASNVDAAHQLIEFLLSDAGQQHFADENYEYPLVTDGAVETHPVLRPLDEIETPDIDLSNLEDLERTLELLLQIGVL